jgi:glutamate synthase domain-containing protein 3
MTGGLLFVWDPALDAKRFFADTAPQARRPTEQDAGALHALLEEHVVHTASTVARMILEDWDREVGRFWVLRPGSSGAPRRTGRVVATVRSEPGELRERIGSPRRLQ